MNGKESVQTNPEQEVAWTPALRAWLEDCARATGFDAAGIADVPQADSAEAEREQENFATWVEAGRAGEMEYLKRRDEQGHLVRGTLQAAIPWARSVIVCALSYNAEAPRSVDSAPSGAGWIARYAWSGRTLDDSSQTPTDYHDELLSRLRRIEAELHLLADCTTRCYVDTGPLLERNVAAKAAVGWIGKNTCVLNQELGSWLLLGVVVTSLPLETQTPIVAAQDRCGTCTRCIDACPTNALLGSKSPDAPRTMDASLCIAYLTIEKKGMIAESLRSPMGRNVFGCDICQDVCPWGDGAKAGAGQSCA
jgi:epoxyqueuosine reductase